MGCNKSDGKKSNKETQSPVLKIFKDMMQRETHDAEKTNLLKSKSEKKTKKYYSGSRSKSENKTESRSSGKRHKNIKQLRNAEFDDYSVNSSTPFQGEKRESWWFWGDTSGGKKLPSDETCSCVSCALRKIISSDYACFACLALLFTISVIAAFLLIYKSIPCYKGVKVPADSERLKRKIDLSKYRWDDAKQNGKQWNDGSNHEIPRPMDFGGSIFQELNSAVDPSSELYKILDSDKLNEIQSSDRLKEFYKKLIQADAQIQNLKKNNELDTSVDVIEDKYKKYLDRTKRSLNILQKPLKMFHYYKNKVHKNKQEKKKANDKTTNIKDKIQVTKLKNSKTTRNKRLDNATEPEGILFENKKVYIKFKPKNRKSKCSHAPKESKSHENQLKHPFYQNTQRLDELLDKFLDKNIQEIMTGPFGLHADFGEKKNKCKHPKIEIDETTKEASSPEKNLAKMEKALKIKDEFQSDRDPIKNKESDTKIESTTHDIFDELEFTEAEKKEKRTTNSYDLLMSVSTLMYDHDVQQTSFLPHTDRVPNMRKLLQADVDDDQNEVMDHDDNDDDEEDKASDTKKMTDILIADDFKKIKTNPASVLNPNWKGPLPLYPDELNSMLKQEHSIANKVETPVQTKDAPMASIESPVQSKDALEPDENIVDRVEIPLHSSDVDNFESNLNDVEYIEDYFRNKYERLVGMAQAYSDYGVFEGRKVSEKKVDDKDGSVPKVKLTLSGIKNRLKNSISGSPKRNTFLSEGFRLELKPTTASREDYIDMNKLLKQHFRLTQKQKKLQTVTDFIPNDANAFYTPRVVDLKTSTKDSGERGFIFTIGKKRTLKSIKSRTDEEIDNDHDVFETKLSVKRGIDDFSSTFVKYKRNIYSVSPNDNPGNVNTMIRNYIKSTTKQRAVKQLEREDNNDNSSTFIKYKREIDSVSPNDNPDNVNTTAMIRNYIKNTTKQPADNKIQLERVDIDNSSTFVKYKRKIDLVSNDNPSHVSTSAMVKDDVNTMKPVDESAANNTKLAGGDFNNTDNNISDFFMSLANLFSALDGVFINLNDSSIGNLSLPYNTSHKNNLLKNNTENIVFPMYDSDMIENIGHRSRVLLSQEDFNVTVNVDEEKAKLSAEKDLGNVNDASKNLTNDIFKIKTSNIEENNTKSVVKRNADDSLIFWNDIYDDEYGVTVDRFENNLRDAHSIDKNNLLKRPSIWFRDKVKKISDKFQKKTSNLKKFTTEAASNSKKKNNDVGTVQTSKEKEPSNKRVSRTADKKSLRTRETDFEALTANMKKVCQKAAHDVRQTRLNAGGGSKQEEVASSLMQQLIRLMTDLVDYQVQERTCRRLPPDLQSFLEWLISPAPVAGSTMENRNSGPPINTYPETDFNLMSDKSQDDTFSMESSREIEDTPDSRSDCFGTLQIVQDLMKEFEDLTDDDKSKITGVREYLESQIQYLQKQLPQDIDFNIYNTDHVRYRRDTSSERNAHHINRKHGLKQKLKNFMSRRKNQQKTDNKEKTDNDQRKTNNNALIDRENKIKNRIEGTADKYLEVDAKPVKEKKNLKDVYYKALEDAKKATTVKSIHRNVDD